jgi:hypothetical protein
LSPFLQAFRDALKSKTNNLTKIKNKNKIKINQVENVGMLNLFGKYI